MVVYLPQYRPQQAVDDFVAWASDESDQIMKSGFYPHVDKSQLFDLGYIARKSQHSRGCAVDVTIVENLDERELDMGTDFDLFDDLAHTLNPNIREIARQNRSCLLDVMTKHGFENYSNEWWHFSLIDEMFPNEYFDFAIR